MVISGKYTAIQAFLKKEEQSQIHSLTLPIKDLEKEEEIKFQTSRIREIIKTRAEMNAIKTKKTKHKQNKTKTNKQIKKPTKKSSRTDQ